MDYPLSVFLNFHKQPIASEKLRSDAHVPLVRCASLLLFHLTLHYL